MLAQIWASDAGATVVAEWLKSIGYEDATRHLLSDLLKARNQDRRAES